MIEPTDPLNQNMSDDRDPLERKLAIFVVHPSTVLTDSIGNGDGLLAYRYICELAKRGHRLAVACEEVTLSFPVPANVTIYPLQLRSRRQSIARRFEYMVKVRCLFERLRAVEPFDLAHQFNPVYAGLSLGLIGADVPLVLGPYVAHWPATNMSRFKIRIRDTISAFQQRFADGILISGPSARTRIVSKRIAARVFTIPYGIDLEAFPETSFPSDAPVVLYLAGFGVKKGILVLLAAFELLAARLPNVRLVIAGDGPEGQQVRTVGAASVYRDRITFVGAVPRADVPEMFSRCTVYCLASFGEPYGMALVEAMTTGRPVVATNAGGPVDLVDPRGGILVPPGDALALAAALETILINPPMASAMGKFNRQAMTAYRWPAVIDRLEAVYSVITAQKSVRGKNDFVVRRSSR